MFPGITCANTREDFQCDTQVWLLPLAEPFPFAGAEVTDSKAGMRQEQRRAGSRGSGGSCCCQCRQATAGLIQRWEKKVRATLLGLT